MWHQYGRKELYESPIYDYQTFIVQNLSYFFLLFFKLNWKTFYDHFPGEKIETYLSSP